MPNFGFDPNLLGGNTYNQALGDNPNLGGAQAVPATSVTPTLVVGPVISPTPASIVPDTNRKDVWTDYECRNYYEKDRHIYMMPGTSPTAIYPNQDSTYFVQLAAPTLLWIAEWTAARTNQMPQIPDPTAVSDNWVLLDEWYETLHIEVGPDGVTPLYRISGVFFYGCRQPSEPTLLDIVFPKPPWVSDAIGPRQPTTDLPQGDIITTAGQQGVLTGTTTSSTSILNGTTIQAPPVNPNTL